MGEDDAAVAVGGPYVSLEREHWARLARTHGDTLDSQTLERLRGIADPTDLPEVEQVYLPLTQLIHRYYESTKTLFADSHDFLGLAGSPTPFIIGVAGSVAVGKSTVSRLLRELLSRVSGNLKVELVTTDGFLYPNQTLERLGLMGRKGFPESYNRKALLDFIIAVKSGSRFAKAPVYSHLAYDILPGEQIEVTNPDILIVEGLNVLQPARRRSDGTTGLAVSDFFDFSVYVDAADQDVRTWYVERFLKLRETAFRDPESYFTRYGQLTIAQATAQAGDIWDAVNGPNLILNIKPTRGRATAILRKSSTHQVSCVRIRKI